MNFTSGLFRARPIAETCGIYETAKGVEYYLVEFELLEGPDVGKRIEKRCWLTPKAAPYTIKELRTCGATFPDGDITRTDGIGTCEVSVLIADEVYNGQTYSRVQFVNPINIPPIDSDKRDKLRERMRALALLESGPAENPAHDAKDNIPF